jgi:AsmA protein
MKLVKIFALFAGIAILLLLIPIAVLVSIDINHYKEMLAHTVEKQTGRQLRIQGSIDKSFFPWLGAHIGALQLSNAEGFGDVPFLQLQEVQVKIKLLPLFKKEIVIDDVVVHGLRLNLARNAQGTGNWEDFVARETAAPAEPVPHVMAPQTSIPQTPDDSAKPAVSFTQQIAALRIGGIDIRDAAVVWDDRQAAVRYELSAFNLHTGELQLGQAFRTKMSFAFSASLPQEPQSQEHQSQEHLSQGKAAPMEGTVQWSALIDAQPQTQQYRLQELNLAADVTAEGLPVSRLSLALTAEVDSNLESQTVNVPQFSLTTLGSDLSGSMQGSRILDEPVIEAQLQWHVNNAPALVDGLKSVLPPTINAALLKDASAQLSATVSLSEQTATVQPLNVTLGALSLQASLRANHIVDNPSFNGSLEVGGFNPRPLWKDLVGELPAMADNTALTQVALNTQFQGTVDSLSLQPLAVTVDGTHVTGSTTVTQFVDPRIVFALNVDAIDIDRYLPPQPPPQLPSSPKSSATASLPAPSQEEEIPLPMDLLRTLKVQGELSVGQLKAMHVKLQQLNVNVETADGVLRADPVQVQLYNGSSTARVTLDVRRDTPAVTLTEVLKGVEFGHLVKDLMSDDYVSGVANIQANLTTQGSRVSELKQQLNGSVGFDFADGVVKYLDLADILIADYAKYLRKALPKDDPGKTTAFRILKGTANITNGVVSNQDLYLQSARFEVFGEGNVDVVHEIIGYTANTQIHNPTNQMIEYGLDKLAGTLIPVHFRGTFTEPTYGVDWESTLRNAAKRSIKREQEKLREQAKQKLQEQQQKLKDKAEQEKEEELLKLEEKLKAEEQKLKDKADEKKAEELRKLKEKLDKLF